MGLRSHRAYKTIRFGYGRWDFTERPATLLGFWLRLRLSKLPFCRYRTRFFELLCLGRAQRLRSVHGSVPRALAELNEMLVMRCYFGGASMVYVLRCLNSTDSSPLHAGRSFSQAGLGEHVRRGQKRKLYALCTSSGCRIAWAVASLHD